MPEQDAAFFDSFRNVVRAVHATLDVQEVLRNMAQTATQTMGLKACAIRLLNPKTRQLELAAAHGLSADYLNKGPVDADQSIADAMAGQTVWIENAAGDERAQYGQAAQKEGIASIVSVPMTIKGRTIGVLRLYTAEPRSFTERELQFAEALAEIGALGIENARMYEQLKQDYEELVGDIHSFVGYRRSI